MFPLRSQTMQQREVRTVSCLEHGNQATIDESTSRVVAGRRKIYWDMSNDDLIPVRALRAETCSFSGLRQHNKG